MYINLSDFFSPFTSFIHFHRLIHYLLIKKRSYKYYLFNNYIIILNSNMHTLLIPDIHFFYNKNLLLYFYLIFTALCLTKLQYIKNILYKKNEIMSQEEYHFKRYCRANTGLTILKFNLSKVINVGRYLNNEIERLTTIIN